MKKTFLLIAAAATLTACNNSDNDSLKLNITKAILTSKETVQIVPKNAAGVEFSCEDEYVATVSNDGMITGQRIGRTTVKASTEKANAYVEVTVNAKYNLFDEPFMQWGISRTQFLAANNEPYDTGENTMTYLSKDSEAADKYKYYFENDRLVRAEVSVYATHSPNLTHFLSERYVLTDLSDGTYTYIDALDEKDATTKIELYVESTTYWIVAYNEL